MEKKKRNIALLILSMMAGVAYLTPLIRFTFYDQMIAALNITDVQLGTIAGVYGIFNVACYIPSGILAEKFNTKKLLALSTLGMCLVTIWYATFPGFKALLVIHALYGIFSVGTFWSPYLKAVRNLGSENEQGRLFGVSEGIRGIGQTAVAFLCLGVSALFASQQTGFRSVLLINAVVFALLMISAIFIVPDVDNNVPKNAEVVQKHKGNSVILSTLKSPSTWICIFVILCGYTLWNTVNGYMGTYGTRILNLSPELSSAISIIRSYIIVFISGVTGGIIMDKFKFKGVGMFWAFAITAVCVVGVFFTSRMLFLCVAITIVLSYLVNVIKATYWSIMGEAGIPLAATGMATGIISLIGLSPDIFVSPIISRFIQYGETQGDLQIGFNMMFVWLIVWAVLGVFAAIILKKQAQKQLQN